MVAAVGRWVGLLLLYLVFAGQVGWSEVGAGAVAAGIATGFTAAVRRWGRGTMRLRAPWLRLVGRTLWGLAVDSVRVGGALVRSLWGPVRGGESVQAFDAGGAETEDAGRRGLVTLCVSLAPNGYVTGVAPGGRGLTMHRLVAVPPKADRRWPV